MADPIDLYTFSELPITFSNEGGDIVEGLDYGWIPFGRAAFFVVASPKAIKKWWDDYAESVGFDCTILRKLFDTQGLAGPLNVLGIWEEIYPEYYDYAEENPPKFELIIINDDTPFEWPEFYDFDLSAAKGYPYEVGGVTWGAFNIDILSSEFDETVGATYLLRQVESNMVWVDYPRWYVELDYTFSDYFFGPNAFYVFSVVNYDYETNNVGHMGQTFNRLIGQTRATPDEIFSAYVPICAITPPSPGPLIPDTNSDFNNTPSIDFDFTVDRLRWFIETPMRLTNFTRGLPRQIGDEY